MRLFSKTIKSYNVLESRICKRKRKSLPGFFRRLNRLISMAGYTSEACHRLSRINTNLSLERWLGWQSGIPVFQRSLLITLGTVGTSTDGSVLELTLLAPQLKTRLFKRLSVWSLHLLTNGRQELFEHSGQPVYTQVKMFAVGLIF